MEQVETKLNEMTSEFKTFSANVQKTVETQGTVLNETKAAVDGITAEVKDLGTRQRDIQSQLDGVDKRTQARYAGSGAEVKSLGEQVVSAPEFLGLFGKGWASGKVRIPVLNIHQKAAAITTTTAGGFGTPGVLPVEYTGLIAPVRRRLFLRDLLSARPTDSGYIQAIKQTSFTSAASPQTEGSAKGESTAAYEPYSVPVQVLAHWITATRQVLEDLPELQAWINTDLMYFLKLKEEEELLSGSGSGQHLTGLITGATAFNTALLGSGAWNKADVVRRAIQQLEILYYDADGIVMHPTDWADLETAKATTYEYVIGNPRASLTPMLWGKPVVVTPGITAGTFLVGAFAMGAVIRDRMDATIDISTEHSTYFTENKVAIRAEERLALVKRHADAFVTGSFSTSPA